MLVYATVSELKKMYPRVEEELASDEYILYYLEQSTIYINASLSGSVTSLPFTTQSEVDSDNNAIIKQLCIYKATCFLMYALGLQGGRTADSNYMVDSGPCKEADKIVEDLRNGAIRTGTDGVDEENVISRNGFISYEGQDHFGTRE